MKTVAIKINCEYFTGWGKKRSFHLHCAQLFDVNSGSFKFTIRSLDNDGVSYQVVTIGETDTLQEKLDYYQQEVIL